MPDYYGNPDNVKMRLQMIGEKPDDDLVVTALKTSTVYINERLDSFGINNITNLTTLDVISELYSIAELLQALYNPTADEARGVSFYISRADDLLNSFIEVQVKTRHPYSWSRTPPDDNNTLESLDSRSQWL